MLINIANQNAAGMESLCTPFSDPGNQSATTFRKILDALSRPGRVVSFSYRGDSPTGLNPNTFAVAQTLFDHDTKVFISPHYAETAVKTNISFHCSASVTRKIEAADFAIMSIDEAADLLPQLPVGVPDYPDSSATAIIEIDTLTSGKTSTLLSGPGIDGATALPMDIASPLSDVLRSNSALYPLGVDILFVHAEAFIGLPRSTRLTPTGNMEEV